jgi:RNA-directed DNA polymerase
MRTRYCRIVGFAFECLRGQLWSYIPAQKSMLEKIQAITSRAELADLLKIKHAALTYLLYVKQDALKYSSFLIPKKSGGKREIHAPTSELKSLQRHVSVILDFCVSDIEKIANRRNKSSHGFMPGKSILTNSAVHRNKRYVFNLDLKDFFPTISGKRIRGLLMNDNRLKFPAVVATTIAHIACRNGVLPQGSPCSPVLSNLIAGILDVHLSRLAQECGCRYTRYADDITFSTNKREFPSAIAIADPTDPHKWSVAERLSSIIAKAGFSINDTKTRMQYKTSRQTVTGLVVNKRVNVPAEYRHLVRAYVFSLINKGTFDIRGATKDEHGNVTEIVKQGTEAQLHGMLGFIHAVDNVPRSDRRLHPYNYPTQSAESKKATGNLAMYRRFLLYTRFYANGSPFVVCEGKTDNVYISTAVHQLRHLFPRLVRHQPDTGKYVLSFSFLKYARQHRKKQHVYMPNFSTASILGGGSGGSANLGGLIRAYLADHAKFKANRGRHPVLVIVDDDSGGKTVFKTIKDTFKLDVDSAKPFTRIFSNLYVIPVFRPDMQETSIEDLFSKVDIAKGLNGKSFDFSKDADPTTTFGKEAFAYQFVAKNADQLDWTNFKPLLKNICAALEDYENLIAADGA